MDQQLGVAHVVGVKHLHVDGPEQVGRVGCNLWCRFLVDAALKVEEVEVELDGAFNRRGIHVAVLPIERINGGAVSPVVAIFVVPGQFFARARVVGAGFLREGTTRMPATDFTDFFTQRDLAQRVAGSVDIAAVQIERGSVSNGNGGPALFNKAQESRVDNVLELGDILFIDNHARR